MVRTAKRLPEEMGGASDWPGIRLLYDETAANAMLIGINQKVNHAQRARGGRRLGK
jgi:hypothetical protein